MLRENDLVGEELQGYSISAELGSSSSKRIFLGESISPTTAHERVVIKLLYAIYAHAHQEPQSVLQEISALQQLHHPHILPILSVGIYEDIPYIITEYVASGSLHDRLQGNPPRQPMQQEQALSFLAQIGQALHYAHQQHVIHGSLKPQNVLFKTPDHVMVTDFHLPTLLLPDKSDTAHPSDASIYLAPEQLAGHTSQKSDQYALGCLAYEMLTGSQAFMIPSVNTPGMYYRTKALIVPGRLNPALPSHIEKAILKAMSRDPAQRYNHIPAFLAAMGISSAAEESNQERVAETANLPMTPIPAIDALETEIVKREHLDKEIIAKEAPFLTVADDAPSSLFGIIRLVESRVQSFPAALIFYKISRKFSLNKAWQRLTFTHQRVLVVILCLVAIAVVMEATLFPFSSPKRLAATPYADTTIIAHSAPQTAVPATIVPATPSSTSSVTTPLQSPVPIHNTVIAQGTAQNQNTAPNSIPTLVPTPLLKPTPTPTLVPTPTPTPAPTPTPTTTLAQVPLSAFFNNEGIGSAPGASNFDGSGYSYPVSQLPSGGSVTVSGVPYQFPVSSPGTNDNILAAGQTIPLTPGHYQQVSFLMVASWGPVTGTVTIEYTNGSSATTSLTAPDWVTGRANGLQTSYRYGPASIDPNGTHIFAITVALDAKRTAKALVLPSQVTGQYQSGRLHVFALTLLP